jgi:uncharacterized protein (TIGR00730 family)
MIIKLKWLFKISTELFRGIYKLRNIGPCVTIFGSSRLNEDDIDYKNVQNLAAELAKRGYSIMTGGGPGLMEAANRGAKSVGGLSIGCCIALPKHEPANSYLDICVSFKYFFTRKIMLTKYSDAFIAAPGGFGTLDELFEIIVLIQTAKIHRCPVYLLNTEYWRPIIEFASNQMIESRTIDKEDLRLIRFSDDPVEIAVAISQSNLVFLNQSLKKTNSKIKKAS